MNDQHALSGLTVIEWTGGVAGAYCGKLLAGFGAEVIKVEPPGGDPVRFHPPFAGDTPGPERGLLFLYLNTGKRSVVVDVTRPAGRDLLDDLVRDAAILVEDHRPDDLAAIGLGYDRWATINPSLVVASVTPFGQTGPRANDRGYHLNTFHAGGEGYTLAGRLTGADRPPVKVGSRVGDFDTGVSAVIATLAAVYEREFSGLGQHVDVSAQDAGIALSRVIHGRYTVDGVIENRLLKQRRSGTLVRCADGYVEIVLLADDAWASFCRLIERPELIVDERYTNRFAREQRVAEVNELVESWAGARGKVEIAHLLQEHHIPGGPYFELDEVAASAQYAARGFFQPVDHPVAGGAAYPTVAYQFSETPWDAGGAAPLLGADTDAVLGQRLGKSPDDLAGFRADGVIS